jgi:hypothetical protein
VTLDLTDDEKAALIELLCETIEGSRFPLSPRLRPYKAILLKLGVGSTHREPYPAPKPSGHPSLALGKKRRR